MKGLVKYLKQGLNGLGIIAITGVMAFSVNTSAQAETGTGIRVLVTVEDWPDESHLRFQDVTTRAMAELKAAMMRHNFKMVDEESVAADLGWERQQERSKSELMQALKLMNESSNASHHTRAMVILRVLGNYQELGYATKHTLRISGDIYDAATNQFLDTFTLPMKTVSSQPDCNYTCSNAALSPYAGELAMSLGDVLGKKLAYLQPHDEYGNVIVSANGMGMTTTYTMTLRHFDTKEGLSVIGVMADEFPGYISHNLITKQSALRRYEYITKAQPYKLEKWLNILLMDMGFDADKQINIAVNNGQIIVDKIVETPNRPESEDEAIRFN